MKKNKRIRSKRSYRTIVRGLRREGYKLTRPRLAVARTLARADDWLTPEIVHQRAAAYSASIGLVTVYRTLALLTEIGSVRRIHLLDGCHGYARRELDHGHHLVCLSCQQVVEFPGEENLSPLIRRVSRQTGFEVQDHMLELLGVCAACR